MTIWIMTACKLAQKRVSKVCRSCGKEFQVDDLVVTTRNARRNKQYCYPCALTKHIIVSEDV